MYKRAQYKRSIGPGLKAASQKYSCSFYSATEMKERRTDFTNGPCQIKWLFEQSPKNK